MFSCEYFKSFKNSLFYGKFQWLFFNYVAFDLISLFHVHIQDPTTRSTTTRTFVFFIITKYLKKEVDNDINVCVDEHSPWRYKDLSMSRHEKAMAWLPPMEKCPIHVYTELLLLPKFDNSSPSVTWDKKICHVIMSYCHHYCLRRSTQWNPFNDNYLLSKFDVSSFSIAGDI